MNAPRYDFISLPYRVIIQTYLVYCAVRNAASGYSRSDNPQWKCSTDEQMVTTDKENVKQFPVVQFVKYYLGMLEDYVCYIRPEWVKKWRSYKNCNFAFNELKEEYGKFSFTDCNKFAAELTGRGSSPVGGEVFRTRPRRLWGPLSLL